MDHPRHILLVANRTASSPELVAAVRERADGATTFHLVVPSTPSGLHRLIDPEVAGRDAAGEQLELALPVLSEAAGTEVTGEVGDADPIAAIADAVNAGRFDEIVVSTLPHRVSKWLRIDLPSKARGFGLPVAHVEAATRRPEPAAV